MTLQITKEVPECSGDIPVRGTTAFSTNVDTLMSYFYDLPEDINEWSDQANALATEANGNAVTAAAAGNFLGDWDDLTGAATIPSCVYHDSKFWTLLSGLADITASEPADANADWALLYSPADDVPVSTIIQVANETVPSGYLECNGATISRTTYAVLFASVSTLYGVGDGSTTFELPDFRGEFLRGWDHAAGNDPNAATRTDAGDGSTTGDHVGTKQADGIGSHTHTFPSGITHGSQPESVSQPGIIAGTVTSASTGGDETRPLNINVMFCIRYQ